MIECTFEETFTYEALYRAHMRGRLSKRDKTPVVRFEMNMLGNVYTLYRRLNSGKFKFGRYHSFTVGEPQKREIQTMYYSDRVVQHVLCDDVLMPYFTRRSIIDNCVGQKGKGTRFALERFETKLRKHIAKHGPNGYFLKCDILKYFPSIPHERLKSMICPHVRDEQIKQMIVDIIDGFHTRPEFLEKYGITSLGEGDKTERGIPVGNQTSQVFGMFYLDKLDRFIKEKLRVKIYSRYMDDFIMVHEDKAELQKILKEIRNFCGELGLALNSKTQIFPLKNGVTYLGFRYFVTAEGKLVKNVKKATKRRLRSRAKLLKKAYIEGIIGGERVEASLTAFHGHLAQGNCRRFEKELNDKLAFATNGAAIRKTRRKNTCATSRNS